jgi:hypothetical protein
MNEVTVTVDEPAFFWCLDHSAVEDVDGCRGEVRLGPYATAAEAADALETARRRTEAWDEQDKAWTDDD